MPTAALNGIDVYFERAGDGPPLLFINGSGSTLAEAAPMLDRLRPHFDVLAHDQRGLGRTAIPDGPYSMAEYAADAAALAAHVGWDSLPRHRHQLRRDGRAGAGRHGARADRAPGPARHLGGRGRGVPYPLHTLADLSEDERAAIGLRLMDTATRPSGWPSTRPSG